MDRVCPMPRSGGEVAHESSLSSVAAVAGWVWERNVRLLMEWLSRVAGYAFDDTDWAAVELLVSDTRADANRWCSYPLIGIVQLEVRLARETESTSVNVEVEGPMDASVQAQIELVLGLLQDHSVQDARGI